MKMQPKEWHERYIEALMKHGLMERTEAEDILNAGMGQHDYDYDPEDAAWDELSYMADN